MKLSLYEACRRNRLTKRFAIWSFGIAFFYSAVCQPVLTWALSDYLIRESFFPIVWEMLGKVTNYLFYFFAFAYMLYLVSRFTLKNCYGFFAIYLASSAFLYTVSLISTCLLMGFEDFVLNDLLDILMYVSFDAVQMGVAVLIAWGLLHKMQERSIRAYYLELTKNPSAEAVMPQWLPFESFYNRENKLMRASLFVSAIPALLSLMGRLYYDVFFYGIPMSTSDILWMIFSYVSDFAFILIGYLIVILLLNRIDMRENQRKQAYQKSYQ
jgi:hypothetical protein